MIRHNNSISFSQRQLRVGELIKQSLGQIFLREEAKVPNLLTKNITVTEVRMSPDLKNARAYVIPLGGKDTQNIGCTIFISGLYRRHKIIRRSSPAGSSRC